MIRSKASKISAIPLRTVVLGVLIASVDAANLTGLQSSSSSSLSELDSYSYPNSLSGAPRYTLNFMMPNMTTAEYSLPDDLLGDSGDGEVESFLSEAEELQDLKQSAVKTSPILATADAVGIWFELSSGWLSPLTRTDVKVFFNGTMLDIDSLKVAIPSGHFMGISEYIETSDLLRVHEWSESKLVLEYVMPFSGFVEVSYQGRMQPGSDQIFFKKHLKLKANHYTFWKGIDLLFLLYMVIDGVIGVLDFCIDEPTDEHDIRLQSALESGYLAEIFYDPKGDCRLLSFRSNSNLLTPGSDDSRPIVGRKLLEMMEYKGSEAKDEKKPTVVLKQGASDYFNQLSLYELAVLGEHLLDSKDYQNLFILLSELKHRKIDKEAIKKLYLEKDYKIFYCIFKYLSILTHASDMKVDLQKIINDIKGEFVQSISDNGKFIQTNLVGLYAALINAKKSRSGSASFRCLESYVKSRSSEIIMNELISLKPVAASLLKYVGIAIMWGARPTNPTGLAARQISFPLSFVVSSVISIWRGYFRNCCCRKYRVAVGTKETFDHVTRLGFLGRMSKEAEPRGEVLREEIATLGHAS